MSINKMTIFDFDFVVADNPASVCDDVMNASEGSASKHDFLITPNAYQLVHFNDARNKDLKEYYRHSAYILPDGMPIVWISKLFKNKLKKRLTGSDFFPIIWEHIKVKNKPATLVLPGKDIADLFKKDYPFCNCFVPDQFQKNDSNYIASFADVVANGIIKNESQFVFIGLGFPKQEILAMHISSKLKEKKYAKYVLFLLLGASFEFYFGLKKRAPVFFQKTGMEWLYRFAKEPARLWKRYTIDNVRFLLIAIKEIFKH